MLHPLKSKTQHASIRSINNTHSLTTFNGSGILTANIRLVTKIEYVKCLGSKWSNKSFKEYLFMISTMHDLWSRLRVVNAGDFPGFWRLHMPSGGGKHFLNRSSHSFTGIVKVCVNITLLLAPISRSPLGWDSTRRFCSVTNSSEVRAANRNCWAGRIWTSGGLWGIFF